jgi:hypothetical protein
MPTIDSDRLQGLGLSLESKVEMARWRVGSDGWADGVGDPDVLKHHHLKCAPSTDIPGLLTRPVSEFKPGVMTCT